MIIYMLTHQLYLFLKRKPIDIGKLLLYKLLVHIYQILSPYMELNNHRDGGSELLFSFFKLFVKLYFGS